MLIAFHFLASRDLLRKSVCAKGSARILVLGSAGDLNCKFTTDTTVTGLKRTSLTLKICLHKKFSFTGSNLWTKAGVITTLSLSRYSARLNDFLMKQKLTWPFLRAEGGRLCWSRTLGAAKSKVSRLAISRQAKKNNKIIKTSLWV
jgi:hypothetical protein